jgi:transcriptional regulator with XRE-family HTH domain
MQKQMRREIGERLKQARLTARLTQQDVATDFLVSRQAISSWESGKTLPDLIEFRELATLYGVSTDKILLGVECVERIGIAALARMRAGRPMAEKVPLD